MYLLVKQTNYFHGSTSDLGLWSHVAINLDLIHTAIKSLKLVHGCHCGPNSVHWSYLYYLSKIVRFWVQILLLVQIFNRWYLCLALAFDGLSHTGAEIFAFKICLENQTNFEEKNSVFTRWNQHHQIHEASENWIFVFKIGAILQTNFKCEYLSSCKR